MEDIIDKVIEVLHNEEGTHNDDIAPLLNSVASQIEEWDFTGDEATHNACIRLKKALEKVIEQGY